MDKDRQEQVIIALKEKGAIQPCPRCQNKQFEVIGEGKIELSRDLPWPTFAPLNRQVPIILVSCNNCGYIAHHAAGLLGLARRS